MAFCLAAGAFRSVGCSAGVGGLTSQVSPPLHVSVFLYQQCSDSRGDLPGLEEASGGSGGCCCQMWRELGLTHLRRLPG